MKTIRLTLFALISILFIFTSCDSTPTGLPHSTGKTLEMLVVTNNKEQWNELIGNTIKEYFGQTIPGLPQEEPLYSMFHLPQEAFITMYKANRIIFIVDINKELTEARIETKKDLWSVPQRVVKISAPDNASFLEMFNERKEGILKLYHEVERERINGAFKVGKNHKLKEKMIQHFGFGLNMPTAYKIAKQEENFMWIRKETQKESQAIIVYTYDYTDLKSFDLTTIKEKRNEFTKRYIPGPSKDSYMIVEDKFIPLSRKEITFKDMYAVETRGLWEVENDFMGGPFLSYTFIDEANNKVITLDSYVYAPKDRKKVFVKQLESILYTFEFAKKAE